MESSFTFSHFKSRFPTNTVCLQHLFTLRYGPLPICPHCSQKSIFSRCKKRPCFACQWCGHQIYPLAGTVFHKSHLPLTTWFFALYLISTSKHGVSAKEMSRHLGVGYKTAWRITKQLRLLYLEEIAELSGVIEADETWIGHKGKKVPVVGLVQRGGKIVTKVTTDVDTKTLIPFIEANVAKGSTLSTDQHRPYRAVTRRGYHHISVNHAAYEWKVGEASTNTLEGHWGHMKRSIRGTYGSISSTHASLYVAEFSWHRNHRQDVVPKFVQLLAKAALPAPTAY